MWRKDQQKFTINACNISDAGWTACCFCFWTCRQQSNWYSRATFCPKMQHTEGLRLFDDLTVRAAIGASELDANRLNRRFEYPAWRLSEIYRVTHFAQVKQQNWGRSWFLHWLPQALGNQLSSMLPDQGIPIHTALDAAVGFIMRMEYFPARENAMHQDATSHSDICWTILYLRYSYFNLC